jgi:aminopeptidase-like protein
MMEMLRCAGALRLAPVSPDADRLSGALAARFPFRVREFPSGEEHNGWSVPLSWIPCRAEIRKNGSLLYDGMAHPLGVVGYGTSFKGVVSLDTLREHLFFHPSLPDSLVYHCDYYYKPWRRSWGFSVSRRFFESLEDGEYEVLLDVEERPGTMKVLEWHLPGKTAETILFNAHTCHAAQVNDGLSGVAVGIEIMNRLALTPNRRYSYKLILAPEHLGTVFYLASLSGEHVEHLRWAIFLEMLGNENRLMLQESFWGTSAMDRALWHVLHHRCPNAERAPFRTVVGNDETVWEAPGYEIPCVSLSRWPYAEYHSDKDTVQIIKEERLEEAVLSVLKACEILENNAVVQRRFDGLVCLGNPRYDLYISTEDPSIRRMVSEEQRRWHYLMTCLPRFFDEKTTLLDIAERFELDFELVSAYVRKYEEKELATLLPA